MSTPTWDLMKATTPYLHIQELNSHYQESIVGTSTGGATHRQHVQLSDPVLLHGKGEWDAVLNWHHHFGQVRLHHTTLITLLPWVVRTKRCVFSLYCSLFHARWGTISCFSVRSEQYQICIFMQFPASYLNNAQGRVNVATSVRPTIHGHT